MKPFSLIVTSIFIALALGAVFVFATFTSIKNNSAGTVVIWGTYPREVFDSLLSELQTNAGGAYDKVTYRSIPAEGFIPELVQAIAAGRGPDLVVFPAENIVAERDKLVTIPYKNLSRREFQNTFIQAGEVFLMEDGIKGIPFSVDPLVMYWNRTLFSNAGIAQPPKYWDELSDMTARLTKAGENGTLTQSAVALGTWDNVDHAKAIFLTLLRQLGNQVVVPNAEGGYRSDFSGAGRVDSGSADSAIRFYTDFADPVKTVYSWNRSQPSSRNAFLSGKLAVYFGLTSELQGIRESNPNLNFDVAQVPFIRSGGTEVASSLTALAIPRGTQNERGALVVAQALTSANSAVILSNFLSLPSVRRDGLKNTPNDPYSLLYTNAALTAFSFLDADPKATNSIFKRIIENVSSGKVQVSEATRGGDEELKVLLGVQ